jgi:hypothetical protein
VCGVAGPSPWLVRLPCAELGFCGSSFRFCLVCLCWPTAIHAPGEQEQPDFTDLAVGPAREAVLGVPIRVSRRTLSCQRGCGQCPHLRRVYSMAVGTVFPSSVLASVSLPGRITPSSGIATDARVGRPCRITPSGTPFKPVHLVGHPQLEPEDVGHRFSMAGVEASGHLPGPWCLVGSPGKATQNPA